MVDKIVVLGIHVRTKASRYLAGCAVVEDGKVVRVASLPAPADADEGRQLEELHGLVTSLIGEFSPDLVAVKVNETRGQKPRSIGHRGEGAVLAAAGGAGVPARLWHQAGLRKPAGLGRSGTLEECVDRLCGELSGEALASSEVEQAAAAAAASLKSRS